MYINKMPEAGEERYWTFINMRGKPTIAKVKVKHRWADEHITGALMEVEVTENIFNKYYKKGMTLNLNYAWTLQKTLGDAKKVMILGIFSLKGYRNSFFSPKPPWE